LREGENVIEMIDALDKVFAEDDAEETLPLDPDTL